MTEAARRICFSFSRGNQLRYLSHLDLLRLFQRALRRASLPLDYSRGFNPRPRLSLAVPLPVGVTAAAEYADLYLREAVSPAYFLECLQQQLPPGLVVTGSGQAVPGTASLAAQIDTAIYHAIVEPYRCSSAAFPEQEAWQTAVQALLSRETIAIRRHGRRDTTDIRPFILALVVSLSPPRAGSTLLPEGQTVAKAPFMEMCLRTGSSGGVSPFVVLDNLAESAGCDKSNPTWRVHREGLYISTGDGLKTPPQKGGVRFWIKKSS